jgi:undecaprenyl-diphosphatase
MIGVGHTWIPHIADASFPSDHAIVFSTVGLCLLLARKVLLGVAVLLVGLGVAWARLYLGVHFPLDMAGAVAVALISFMLIMPTWRLFGVALTDRVERLYREILRVPIARRWVRR